MVLTPGEIRKRVGQIGRVPVVMSEFVGWLLAIMGGLGGLGWIAGLPFFIQPSPGSPPILPNEVIALVAVGAALVALARGKPTWAMGGAVVGVFLGAATLSQYFWGTNLGIDSLLYRDLEGLTVPPGFRSRMPVSTALGFTLAGSSVLALAIRGRRDAGLLVSGVFGSVLLALFSSLLLGRATGVLEGVQFGLLVGTSLQAGLGFLLVGANMVSIAWKGEGTAEALPRWLPFAVFLASLVTVVFVWKALVNRERALLMEQVAIAGNSGRQQVVRQVSVGLNALRHVATHTAIAEGTTNTWGRDVGTLARDLEGLDAIVWTDDSGFEVATVPAAADVGRLLGEVRRKRTMLDSISTDVAVFALPFDSAAFGVRVAVCRPPDCTGQIIGLFNTARLLGPQLSDTTTGYHYRVGRGPRHLFQTAALDPELAQWVQRFGIDLGGMRWQLEVWPTRETMLRSRSALPEVVLVLGLFVTALLPVTLRLAQTNWDVARRAERARLSLALERATDGIWEWDVPTGRVVRSASLWRHLAYDPDSMGTRMETWTSLIHPEDQARVQAAIAGHLAGRSESYEAEYRIRHAQGEWHNIVDRGRIVQRAPSGDVLRVLGITADVTDRKRADDARESSERRFRAMFDSALQFELLLDLDARLLEANRTALEFTGVALEEVRGTPLWEFPWWDGSPASVDRLKQACRDAAGGRTVRYEVEIVGRERRPAVIDFSLRPVFDGTGTVAQLLAEARDITASKRAEAQLREVDTLSTMGRLAARVAHEINNPLAGIQNAFLLVKDSIPPDHPHAGYVGAIEREIARIAAVTRQLYETYRPEEDGRSAASVHMVVGDAVAFLAQVNRGANVTIETDLTRAPAVVAVPDSLLRQAVYNLVQNAVEASPPGGTVKVAATASNGSFVLSVRDEGPGIPVELRQRIFEEGFTTKGSGVKTGGMGIGLALVRRSVHALGGRIEIHSPEDGGTEFVVRLPVGGSDMEKKA